MITEKQKELIVSLIQNEMISLHVLGKDFSGELKNFCDERILNYADALDEVKKLKVSE